MSVRAGVVPEGTGAIRKSYGQVLREYLRDADEKNLADAYELGRKAFAKDVGILEVVALHHEQLRAAVSEEPRADAGRIAMLSGQFLREMFSAYEMGRRAYGDSVCTLRHLNELLEQEVKRLAHAVHDEAGQLLVAAHLAIAEVMPEAKPDVQRRLTEVTDLLLQAEDQLREFSHELRPTMLDDLGLVPALQSLASGIAKRKKVEVRVNASLEERLPPSVEIGLYRAVQEALTNVTRHSKAKIATVEVRKGRNQVLCTVEDDGVGFDAKAVLSGKRGEGLGLIGIQERLNVLKGSFHVESEIGQGSRVRFTVPVEEMK